MKDEKDVTQLINKLFLRIAYGHDLSIGHLHSTLTELLHVTLAANPEGKSTKVKGHKHLLRAHTPAQRDGDQKPWGRPVGEQQRSKAHEPRWPPHT